MIDYNATQNSDSWRRRRTVQGLHVNRTGRNESQTFTVDAGDTTSISVYGWDSSQPAAFTVPDCTLRARANGFATFIRSNADRTACHTFS